MFDKKILLAFDMDDTLVKTGEYLHRFVYNWFAQLKRQDYMKELADLREKGISTMNYPIHLKEVIDEKCVGNGLFMLHSGPSQLGQERSIHMLRRFLREYPGIIDPVICTHRGFHENGEQFTRTWLDSMGMGDIFNVVHCIDPAEHKDKITYLIGQYPEHEIVLVDDNPLGKHDQEHDFRKEILLYEEENPLNVYDSMKKVQGMAGVLSHVQDIVYQIKGWDA